MPLIVPYFAEAQTAIITIDGVTCRVPLLDGDSRLYVTPRAVGASEVKAARKVTVDPATTRVTIATPTSGTKIRVISLLAVSNHSTGSRVEVYFGTGANIGTTAGKEVADPWLDVDVNPSYFAAWPDGAGPVGAADDVLSLRCSVNVAANVLVVVHYREE